MKKVHFIGICGKGMSAVAKLLIDKGITITGSDENFYPPVSTYLEKNSIPFKKGFKKENIEDDVDTVVISKHAALLPNINEEVAQAFLLKETKKVKVLSFPEILRDITIDRTNLVLAGSYGKSTISALTAHLLLESGVDAGYLIGATPITPTTNASIGTNKLFVLEGDEYPSANWDSTSKFMYYHPQSVLITSLAHDHTNIFKTHNDFKKPFFELMKIIDNHGSLIVCLDDKTIKEELENIKSIHPNVITYSVEDNSSKYYAKNILFGEETIFSLVKEGEVLGNLKTTLLGRHNIQNIIGAVALLLEVKAISFSQIAQALPGFIAVEGRLNKLPTRSGILLFEGFGSSVDKAKSAIDAMRLHFPNKKIKIIFEPHTFSWRNKEAIHWYDEVFRGAEMVYVYEPPHHGQNTINQSTQEEIVERINKSGVKAYAINNHEEALKQIVGDTSLETDIILTLTSGNFDGLIEKLIKEI